MKLFVFWDLCEDEIVCDDDCQPMLDNDGCVYDCDCPPQSKLFIFVIGAIIWQQEITLYFKTPLL